MIIISTKDTKLMMQKINSWAPRRSEWTMLWMGVISVDEKPTKWTGWKSNTPVWRQPNRLRCI